MLANKPCHDVKTGMEDTEVLAEEATAGSSSPLTLRNPPRRPR